MRRSKKIVRTRTASRAEVDALFRDLPASYARVASELRRTIRGCAPTLTETVRWNNPFWVGRAPVVCLQCYPDHVNLGFLRGAELDRVHPELKGTGKAMRHLKITTVLEARSVRVKRLVRDAARLDAAGSTVG